MVTLVEERDLAIAHDRQPYPTAWAYEQACVALERHRERADAAEARLAEFGEPTTQWTSERHIGRMALHTAKACDTEAEALEIVAEDRADGIEARLAQRMLGQWSTIEQREA